MLERTGWAGSFDIFITGKDGTTEHEHIDNTITTAGLNLLRNAIKGDVTDCQLKYLAVGTSSTSVAITDTQLGAEIFRTPFLTYNTGGEGILQSTALLLDNEAVANIREVGIFAGSTASSTTNSGIMISRILYSRNKTNLESIQFNRTDTIGRA
jgi:hypothetical protein